MRGVPAPLCLAVLADGHLVRGPLLIPWDEAHNIIIRYTLRGRRLEGWPNTAARLAGWRRVTQQGVIVYVMDGPCRLP
jgi:hypothetical protein